MTQSKMIGITVSKIPPNQDFSIRFSVEFAFDGEQHKPESSLFHTEETLYVPETAKLVGLRINTRPGPQAGDAPEKLAFHQVFSGVGNGKRITVTGSYNNAKFEVQDL